MKRKVLFLLHLPPPIHGSSLVGFYIKNSDLLKDNLDSRFINLLASRKTSNSGKITIDKILNFFILTNKLLIEILTRKPNICYFALSSTGAALYKDFILVLILKLFRVKIVFHLHNKGIIDSGKLKINDFVYRVIFRNSGAIVLAPSLVYDVEKYIDKINIHVCNNGIPADVSNRLNFTNNIPNILFLSNLFESKGLKILIQALKLLKNDGVLFSCSIVGAPGDVSKEELENYIELNDLEGVVSYEGVKYDEQKELCFAKADIFAFPTFYPNECFPLVLIEAMKYKIPIVTTNEGGIADMVEDGVTGFLVKQQNIESLKEKLTYLINNPTERKNIGEKGYEKFKNEFTLEKFEFTFLSILRDIS